MIKPTWKLEEERGRYKETRKLALEIAKAMSQSVEVLSHWVGADIVGATAYRIARGLENEAWENMPSVRETNPLPEGGLNSVGAGDGAKSPESNLASLLKARIRDWDAQAEDGTIAGAKAGYDANMFPTKPPEFHPTE